MPTAGEHATTAIRSHAPRALDGGAAALQAAVVPFHLLVDRGRHVAALRRAASSLRELQPVTSRASSRAAVAATSAAAATAQDGSAWARRHVSGMLAAKLSAAAWACAASGATASWCEALRVGAWPEATATARAAEEAAAAAARADVASAAFT